MSQCITFGVGFEVGLFVFRKISWMHFTKMLPQCLEKTRKVYSHMNMRYKDSQMEN